MPVCPMCTKEIGRIFTSRTVQLVWKEGKWVEEQQDHYFISACPECYEEFSPDELDKLGVPEEIR